MTEPKKRTKVNWKKLIKQLALIITQKGYYVKLEGYIVIPMDTLTDTINVRGWASGFLTETRKKEYLDSKGFVGGFGRSMLTNRIDAAIERSDNMEWKYQKSNQFVLMYTKEQMKWFNEEVE